MPFFMTEDTLDALLAQTIQRWDVAEGRIKLAERVRGEVVLPSVNELRYAGRRVIDGLVAMRSKTPDGHKIACTHFIEAHESCLKAEHDAIDATITFIDAHLDRMVGEFGLDSFTLYFPRYTEVRSAIRKVNDLIVASRQDRTQRSKNYSSIESNHLRPILELYRDTLESEKLLKAAKQQRDKVDRRKSAIAIIGVLIGIAGLAVAIASWIVPTN